MEFLGHFTNNKSKDKKNNSIDLVYSTVELFCDATSKMIQGFNGDCRFMVANDDGDRYFLNVLDYRFISKENTIRIYPENLKKYQKR